MQEHIIFDRVADATRVNRRLRDFGVLSRVVQGRRGQKPELHVEVTTKGAKHDRDLAIRIYRREV